MVQQRLLQLVTFGFWIELQVALVAPGSKPCLDAVGNIGPGDLLDGLTELCICALSCCFRGVLVLCLCGRVLERVRGGVGQAQGRC